MLSHANRGLPKGGVQQTLRVTQEMRFFCLFRVISTGLAWVVGVFESVAREPNLE